MRSPTTARRQLRQSTLISSELMEERAHYHIRIRKVVRIIFLSWATISTLWLANTMRTRGVPKSVLQNSPTVSVINRDATLEFITDAPTHRDALIFFCGSGVAAQAYAPLLRPIADTGYSVFIIKLPYRFAPFESHKRAALKRAAQVMRSHPSVSRWVVAGHSLGGALAARMVSSQQNTLAGLVLIGTTHPKEADLSSLQIPVTKVFGSQDGIARPERVSATKHLLPQHTEWVEVEGGNHSQFGNYGHQLFDGDATISRAEQQAIVRSAIVKVLKRAEASEKRGLTSPCGREHG